ncbi:MAG: RluA family pseudouridine synthase [Candidatus Latescibacterota bacterium]|nr:MAG: RluA family pseudouridine synthase [Candidatus Latescibacterota bacterium]
MTEKNKITLSCRVDAYRSGWSVVDFLAHRFRYHTSERWATRVTDGWVLVNGSQIRPDHVVHKDDLISYTIFHTEPEVDFRYDIVYEDDYLLAVSKSGNIPVHACGVYIRNTLIATLKNIYGDHLNLAHRLDKETSGVVLLSKNPETARVLGKMFAEGKVKKTYMAVVHGRLREKTLEINAPIGKTMDEATGRFDELDSDLSCDLPRYVPRRHVDFERGKPAVTRIEVERHMGDYTVVRAVPLSGRTNQIRVHLDYIGHPIVGDKVYGPASSEGKPLRINRQALHCGELRFAHPVTQRLMQLAAEVPEDIAELVSRLAVR